MSYDDLKAAAKAARYLASTAASIRALQDADSTDGVRKLSGELNEFYPAARAAVARVAIELKRTRTVPARLGDIKAPTAHEVAVEMVFALNRERFGVEVLGRKQIGVWPDADEVLAEIEIEYAKALSCREDAGGAPEAESGEQPQEPTVRKSIDDLADDAMMTHVDLAKALGLDSERLRNRLRRWQAKHMDGWQEVTEPKPRQPKYVYRVGAVRDVLRSALAAK